jgi:hypothetical protein
MSAGRLKDATCTVYLCRQIMQHLQCISAVRLTDATSTARLEIDIIAFYM